MYTTRKKVNSSVKGTMFQVVRSIDITTVVIHLILITAGAFLALFLSNVQQTKMKREKEVMMLQQLHQSLSADLRNLESLATYRQTRLDENRALRNYLVSNQPWNDSISLLFYAVSSSGIFIPHSGPFESLKSTGIDLIQNPEIRIGLFSVYEENFKALNLMEENYDQMLSQQWLPLLIDQLVIDSSPSLIRPVNFDVSRTNPRLLNFVSVFILENVSLLNITRSSIVDANMLVKQIEFELARIQQGRQNDFTPVKTRITLKGYTNAKVVTIPGTFNNWEPDADTMKRIDDGWSIELSLPPGWYMYRFRADGIWMDDPASTLKVQNEYNSFNSLLEVE